MENVISNLTKINIGQSIFFVDSVAESIFVDNVDKVYLWTSFSAFAGKLVYIVYDTVVSSSFFPLLCVSE